MTNFSILLTAPPSQAQAACAHGLPVAHMAYRLGPGPHLLRSSMPVSLRGGLLMMDDQGWRPGPGDAAAFCQELKRECLSRGYEGIIANWGGLPSPELVGLTRAAAALAAEQGWPFYVPERFGEQVPQARVLVSSALSGGSLQVRLQEAGERFGSGRMALAVERVCQDFSLPSPNGRGRELSPAQLDTLKDGCHPSVYFSDDLCARYFTYRTQDGSTHFVLFDDGSTIRKKLQVARELGLAAGVMAYPEVSELLPVILN